MNGLQVEEHPLLQHTAFLTSFEAPLGELKTPEWVSALFKLEPDPAPPLTRDEDVRKDVRALLRHGGYRPTGRGKPASEYLARAAGEAKLGSINAAVDVLNAVSLHSGLPISVIDLERARAPFRIAIAPADSSYIFNPGGQVIRLDGLLCLFDAEGPCANAVKDAQRTKTSEATRRTLSIVWGTNAHPERVAEATRWYRESLEHLGARTEDVG